MQVFFSWSGGKDSCLALYRALKAGFNVKFLFNMLSENGLRSRSHGLRKEILDAQAKAVGIPIIYGKASWEAYEDEFKKIIRNLRGLSVEGGVFGDINIQEHRDWVEKVCSDAGVKAFEPLWGEKYEILLNEFISKGFEAVVVNTKADLIGEEWIGRPFDWEFIGYLRSRDIDLCGEKGEYHTLVTYGPMFKQRIEILESRRTVMDGRWILDVLKFSMH
ncbi:MAG: diphthine--ammonia ligase [archaeon]|nr:diphthine--ammonia ligase [archaeon]MCP8321932.1 diphthine--ammonia ligase [archaeon]